MTRAARIAVFMAAAAAVGAFIALDRGIHVGSRDIVSTLPADPMTVRVCRYFSLTGTKSYGFIVEDEPEAACALFAPAILSGPEPPGGGLHDIPVRIEPHRLKDVRQP